MKTTADNHMCTLYSLEEAKKEKTRRMKAEGRRERRELSEELSYISEEEFLHVRKALLYGSVAAFSLLVVMAGAASFYKELFIENYREVPSIIAGFDTFSSMFFSGGRLFLSTAMFALLLIAGESMMRKHWEAVLDSLRVFPIFSGSLTSYFQYRYLRRLLYYKGNGKDSEDVENILEMEERVHPSSDMSDKEAREVAHMLSLEEREFSYHLDDYEGLNIFLAASLLILAIFFIVSTYSLYF